MALEFQVFKTVISLRAISCQHKRLKKATLSNKNMVPGSIRGKHRPKSMEVVEAGGILSMSYLVAEGLRCTPRK